MKLDHLNESQRAAVTNTEGPVMILAGAGSGKTRTLVGRIQYLIEKKEVSPYKILAVTFSNKAAKEMRERLASAMDIDSRVLQLTTFHSFCAQVLRREFNFLGLSRNFTIYDDGESKSVMKAILSRRGISKKETSPAEVLYYIADIQNGGFYLNSPARDDERVDADDEFYPLYVDYVNELSRSNAVDFGGLITGVIELFEKHPEVLERYQKRFDYVLVDEYQDTNRAQFQLIKLLSAQKKNICVVGDEDQSIYSWRGADIRNILDFEKVFPDASLIKLEQNYRSSQTIIDAASVVIANNEFRKGKEMWTSNDRGEAVTIVETIDDKKEAEFIASEIEKLAGSGVSLQDIAIFYRNNSQSRSLEDALRRIKYPYRVVAGIKFYDRKEVKDLLSYLRCIVNDKDSLALTRVINVPARGVGARTLSKIEDEAIKLNMSLWELLERMVQNLSEYKHLRLSGKVTKAFKSFVELIEGCKQMELEGERPSVIYEKVLHESGYFDLLKNEKTYESMTRLENLEEFLSAIKDYEQTVEKPTIVGFLESITLDSEVVQDEFDGQQVSLMTVHGSKGLEYPYVFLAGAEESIFPSYRSLESGDKAIEEERRLFYVAMTRAMKRLYITFAQGRMLWGSLKFNGPSRFIDEIPDDHCNWIRPQKARRSSYHDDESAFFDQSRDQSSEERVYSVSGVRSASSIPSRSTYQKGVKIKHKLYGAGIVLESEGFGSDEKVVIKFNDGARKKFMVKFAPIEVIS